MGLREDLLRGIYAYGFEKPSAIQQVILVRGGISVICYIDMCLFFQRAIRPILRGHDVIAQAQSGTGKTATFTISILQQIDASVRECQALILAPTRELAQQIVKVYTS